MSAVSAELPEWYVAALITIGALAVFSLPLLLFAFAAPYGRHFKGGWGPTVGARLGWVLMEAPAALGFALAVALSGDGLTTAGAALVALYMGHYLYRSVVYPFRIRPSQARQPVITVASGALFNTCNGPANGYAIAALSPHLTDAWLVDPRFLVGVAVFFVGLGINRHADAVLRRLRAPGETGYKIPYGGLYRWVSSPNYLGEIIQWGGFALAAWTLPGAAFAAFTAVNLVPRALSNHRWYQRRFADYPTKRRALIPWVM